jgi:hypothetical protein
MKLTITKLLRQSSAVGCILGGLAVGLRAQSTPPATTTTTTTTTTASTTATDTAPANSAAAAASDQVTALEKYTVTDVPLGEQILPTVRPVGDVMGDDRNILDIPRSVSAVNEAMMNDRMVKNAMDFGQFAPGV